MSSIFSIRLRTLAPIAVALSLASSPAFAEERHMDSHEHGVSELKIAQDGDVINLELEAPGEDIVGFEHKPKSDAEKATLEAALAKLKKPDTLFSMAADAGCTLTKSHAEFETEDEHAGFHVKWAFKCTAIDKANKLQVSFFDAFPNAKEVEVEALGSKGQVSIEFEKGMKTLDLSKAFGG